MLEVPKKEKNGLSSAQFKEPNDVTLPKRRLSGIVVANFEKIIDPIRSISHIVKVHFLHPVMFMGTYWD